MKLLTTELHRIEMKGRDKQSQQDFLCEINVIISFKNDALLSHEPCFSLFKL